MTGIPLILTFVVAIAVMIVAISKFKVHPFIAIMGISLVLALVVGIPLIDIAATDTTPAKQGIATIIGAGFSGTFAGIGIVIILGALVGTLLERTGAAIKLADMVVKMVGKKHPELAIMIMGWIVSIPVFCDSGFVILDPIRKALRRRTQTSSVAMTVALSAGLYASHVLIPPTPGPIAAAGSLGLADNLLLVMAMGALISVPALIAAYFYALYIGKKVKSSEDEEDGLISQTYEELVKDYKNLPSGFMALAPILSPVLLMAVSSVVVALKMKGSFITVLRFLGNPMIALTVGLLFGVYLLFKSGKISEFNALCNDTLKVVGPILFVTAAGGVLGKVIASAGFVEYMKANASSIATIGIFFPFIIAAILKTAQGSSTVAITTTAGILGSFAASDSMMNVLGLNTPMLAVLAVMAIGAGSMTVSHANDSYFWVVTNFGGMKTEDGYATQTGVTLVMGIAAMAAIFVLSLFL
ncbi:MAG: gluconate transporter [Firmicutes bacterium GWF2_51_9]|nr:GntP family permease [Erysipelotrichaceae bacterium]OGS53935.1 MAG: gluconate transporter [Firmicutes bacterium GWF2_51_9]OGS58424.1 MAG: gluconate transporter [Firmicutes bacterium GWE2_51_13]HAM63401.1 gluconate transporter [Erysipelotrichaceae bacterium]HAO62370.1 gluconate transporter [Erysipelotrichaceae bacterium]